MKKEDKLIKEYKKALEEEKLIEDYKRALEEEKIQREFEEYFESLSDEDKELFENFLADPNWPEYTEEELRIYNENRKKRPTEEELKNNIVSEEELITQIIFEEYFESLSDEDKELFENFLADPNWEQLTREELKIYNENRKKRPTEEELKNSLVIQEQKAILESKALNYEDVHEDLTNKEIKDTLANYTLSNHVQDTGDRGRAITLELFDKLTDNEREAIIKAAWVYQEEYGWTKHIIYNTGFAKIFGGNNKLISVYPIGQNRAKAYFGIDRKNWRTSQIRFFHAANTREKELKEKEEEIRKERNLPQRHDYTGPAREVSEEENL